MKVIKKVNDEPIRKPSYRQKLAITKYVENRGSLGKAMIEAGYSPNTAKNPRNLTNSKVFQREVGSLVNDLSDHLQEILAEMRKKIGEAKYSELVTAFSQITSALQLISGKATYRLGFGEISEEVKDRIREVVMQNVPSKPDII